MKLSANIGFRETTRSVVLDHPPKPWQTRFKTGLPRTDQQLVGATLSSNLADKATEKFVEAARFELASLTFEVRSFYMLS